MNEEQKEKKQDQGIVNKLKDSAKKEKKKGSKFKMILKAIAAALPAIKALTVFAIAAAIITFLGAFTAADEQGNNKTAGNASKKVIEENVEIAKTNDGKYYFKIDKNIINEYLKKLNEAYEAGYYNDAETKEDDEKEEEEDKSEENGDEKEGEEEKEEGENKEDEEFNNDRATIKKSVLENIFGTKDYQHYLVKMIRAEVASTYPVLSDYDGEWFSEDDQDNKRDKDGNYVGQGVVQIQRTPMSEDGKVGNPVRLNYISYEEFSSLVSAGDKTALNYYSFGDDKSSIYYATYRRVVTNGTETEYKLTEGQMSYKSVASMCSMPYNFLFTLLQESNHNPEWIMKVIDLLLEDSEVILMIQDQMNVTTNVTKTAQMQRTTTSTSTKTELPVPGEGGSLTTEDVWIGNGDASASYTYVNETTTEEITYQNTANVFIKKANTWCVDFEQEAVPEEPKISFTENTPEHSNSEFTFGEGSSSTSESGDTKTTTTTAISNETVTTYTSTESKSYTCKVNTVTEKKINHEKFLGLWKNEKGKYELGARFKEDGKAVGYELPRDGIGYPPNDISTHNGYRIERVLELLRLHEDTQFHEQLMMYFWNKYKGEDVYDVDVDSLLNLFNTNIGKTNFISGSALSNFMKCWENGWLWRYETKQSTSFPTGYLTEDEKNYIVREDGSNGHNNIGYGIATYIGDYPDGYYNNEEVLKKYGVDVTTLYEGALVPVEAGRNAFNDILQQHIDEVEDYLSKRPSIPELSKTQKDALTAVHYQYGNILSFESACLASLNEDGTIDPQRIKVNFSPFNYTSTTNNRKYANWYLFTEGKYIDGSGNEIAGFGGSFLEAAKTIHDYMSNPDHLYYYCLTGPENERWMHVDAGLSCGLSNTFADSQIPGKYGYRLTCCATYVSWALEESGYFPEGVHYNGCESMIGYIDKNLHWEKIYSYSELAPGDIVFMDTNGPNDGNVEHVQIYVGEGKWYNAGSTSSTQRVEPYYDDCSYEFLFAYRIPN